jgi:hypothetical protein
VQREPQSQPQSEGFFSSLARKVGLGGSDTTATATPASSAKPKEAKPLPKAFKPVEPKSNEPKQADSKPRPPLKPSVTDAPAATAAAPAAAPKESIVAGAQPIVPTNSFDSRFSAMK